ncbi:cupin-like domain-containing protein [Acetobacteraceae bacterium H6797]|nr:cupin-like domain-containing protein [Acetobacteraceae bacterium H6797]
MAMTLADILAPITPEEFFAEYYDKQPLHVPGGAAKFASVLSWRQINKLLDMANLWSNTSLKVVLDGQTVPPEQYSVRAQSRDNTPVLQPDSKLVQQWISRGASLVMNDVDCLTPGLSSISEALEGAGLGKTAANVYISWQSHKAFASHYDTHDVWAVQVEGEKTWNIWDGRADYPIAHPAFRGQPQAHHDQAKGKLRGKVTVKTGDLLYLPRGWYHDALAEAPASVHIAYGVNAPIGIDVMQVFMERIIHESLFRQPMPRQDGTAAAQFALTNRIQALGAKLAELAKDPKVLEVARRHVSDFRFPRSAGYDLLAARGIAAPSAPSAAAETGDDVPSFRVVANGAKPVRRGADWVLKTAQGSLTLSPPEAEAVNWVLSRPDITEPELKSAQPSVEAEALLGKLRDAGLLVATA